MRATSAIAICFVTLLMAHSASAAEAEEPQPFRAAPGCKWRRAAVEELQASLKSERKIPYDQSAKRLESCNALMPGVTSEMRQTGQTRIAIFVFDVNGSGQVVEQQLLGQKSQWTEVSEKTLLKKLFEPWVEGDLGITRVGVTMAFIAEFEGHGQSCGNVPAPVIPDVDMEIRVCATRY